MRRRRGFALLTVLWLTVAASVVALAGSLAANDTIAAARNRADLERAYWRANDCLERQRAAIDDALDEAKSDGRTLAVWRRLDRSIGIARQDDCEVTLEAAGSRLDVNTATAARLRALFLALNRADAEALADRLLDWIDADDIPRANGAESDWYAGMQRPPPRNGPIADVREIARVAGLESLGSDSLFDVDSARISINTAPIVVLATVPGFTPELLARVAIEREGQRTIGDILALAASVSRPAADSLMAHYPEIVNLTTVNPDAWVLTARGFAGTPPITATIETRLVLGQQHSAVTRRRSWQ